MPLIDILLESNLFELRDWPYLKVQLQHGAEGTALEEQGLADLTGMKSGPGAGDMVKDEPVSILGH